MHRRMPCWHILPSSLRSAAPLSRRSLWGDGKSLFPTLHRCMPAVSGYGTRLPLFSLRTQLTLQCNPNDRGYYCPEGSTNSTQIPCPAGRFGSAYGLASSECNPNCTAAVTGEIEILALCEATACSPGYCESRVI